MLTSFLLFFVVYFLVAFVALLGFFWQDDRFFWLAWINFLSLLLFFVVSFFIKKQENSVKSSKSELKEEKVRYPQQFVKYPHVKTQKKWKTIFWYLLFVSLFLFLFSVLDLTIFNMFWQLVWISPFLYLILLFISGKDLIDNKLKIFWITFDFYLFLFVSSFVVGVLVYWTLIFGILPILILAALLVSFLFFFVWYVFVKNQGFRFFFKLIYSRIYFVAIFVVLIWSISVIPSKRSFSEITTKLNSQISMFFQKMFEKENKDPLLYTWQWEVVTSGFVQVLDDEETDDYFFEESWEVLTPSVNPVFIADEDVELVTWSLDQKDLIQVLKEELWIKDADTISMIDSLRFLMESNKISISTNTNTRFTYVSSTNPFYPYWKTAYDKSMIGAKTNPSTKITCETYQVFKWMLLDWDLQYTSANVKRVFRDEAKKLDVLNGCEYGKLLKGENL